MLVTLVDEEPGRPRESRGAVTVAIPSITVRDLILTRLELELERLRDEMADRLSNRWLASLGPLPSSRAHREPPARPDREGMAGLALAAFERGRYFVLVNDRQVTELDETVALTDTTEVTFLRLTPLQGG